MPGSKKTLSPIQRETLEEIRRMVGEHGFPPTITELAGKFGIRKQSAHDRVNKLIDLGYLKRVSPGPRGISVIKREGEIRVRLTSVPIVGHVPAGEPILAEENVQGEILVDANVIGRSECFALLAAGESMTDVGIEDGCPIIVRQQQTAEDGDIVVVSLNNEVTVKRLHRTDESIMLIPENRNMGPVDISPEDDLRIIGVVIGWHSRSSQCG